ncbi:hypothetical protein GOV11_04315 [Candidatus Woesearchaeota archaeon]|nr:hypothetical protein [Candidatus Woesearchaeota archaeon]
MRITPILIILTSAIASVFSLMVYANGTFVTIREYERLEHRLIRIEEKLDVLSVKLAN